MLYAKYVLRASALYPCCVSLSKPYRRNDINTSSKKRQPKVTSLPRLPDYRTASIRRLSDISRLRTDPSSTVSPT